MNTRSEVHKRILKLISGEQWKGFCSDDESLLRAMLITEHIEFFVLEGAHGQCRLRLSSLGWVYLSHLTDLPN
jgi:hypothetical protein